MTVITKTTARSFFETGDKPTQAQFEALIDSVAWANGTGTGVVEIESTNSSTILARGAVGRLLLSAIATASAQRHIGAGTVGIALIEAVATASALNQLGAGTVGTQLLSAIATASAQNQLALGTADSPQHQAVRVATIQTTAGTNVVTLNSNGELNFPLQSAFLAYASSAQDNLTGNGTAATIVFGTEIFDQNADFASNTLTAPVTGRYLLIAQFNYSGGAAAISTDFEIVTSNRTYQAEVIASTGTFTTMAYTVAVIADMDAADTATARLTGYGQGGDVLDMRTGTTIVTFFCGALIA